MRRAVGIEVLKVDLRPREEVSAHWEADESGRPSTSRLRRGSKLETRWSKGGRKPRIENCEGIFSSGD